MPKAQWERVLDVLIDHPNGLSQLELNEIVHLPATSKRISDLRDRGFVIDCEPIEGKDYGRYVLVSFPPDWGGKTWEPEPNTTTPDTLESKTPTPTRKETEPQTKDITGGLVARNACTPAPRNLPSPSRKSDSSESLGGLLEQKVYEPTGTRFRVYVCDNGHEFLFYGQGNERERCDKCNYREWGTLKKVSSGGTPAGTR